MRNLGYLKKIFVLLALLIQGKLVISQTTEGLAGTEFWLTYTQNLYRPDSLVLLVAPETTDTVVVFNPQMNFSLKPVAVKPGIQNKISVPASMVYSVLAFGGQGTGVVVRSKRNIQLYAYNTLTETMEMTAVLPVNYLKNAQHYILHGWGGSANREAQAAILAIDTGNTTIRVRLKADLFTGQGNGSSFTFTLKQGQVYVLQALDSQDLSGTEVSVTTGCKRIAAFYGVKCARIKSVQGCSTFDHIYEQCWPGSAMGKEFIVPPVPGNSRFQISVAALFNGTTVKIWSSVSKTLNRGEVWKVEMNTSGPVVVEADQPISCVQLLNSQGCNGSATNVGDPALLNIAPVYAASFVKSANYIVHNNPFYSNHTSLIARGNTAPVIRQNGTVIAIPGGFVPVNIAGRSYWYGSFNSLPNNTYKLECDSGFIGYLYGLASNEAYATCMAASPVNRRADFSMNPNPVCRKDQQITFKAFGDSLNNVRWLFGDGGTSTSNPAAYKYGKSGNWQVKLLNETDNRCKTDTVVKMIKIYEGIDLNLPRDTQPCRGSTYRVQLPALNGVTYKWENGSSSTYQLFTTNRKAILITKDTNGCTAVDTLEVRFQDCSELDLRLANVFTPDADGKNDEWVIGYAGWDKIDVKIINRWGQWVTTYSLPKDGHWNGKAKGDFVAMPAGTYFYFIECWDEETRETKTVTGSINLIR